MNIPFAASSLLRPSRHPWLLVRGSLTSRSRGASPPRSNPKAGGGAALKVGAMTFELFTDHGANWIPLASRTRTPGGWERSALGLPGLVTKNLLR